VQVSTLRYELENIKQEQELQTLQHEKETREIQIKADADFRKAQVRDPSPEILLSSSANGFI
jgi:mitotic spindle assembly checkpoint protein MAD1